MKDIHLTLRSSSRIKEVHLNGKRKAAIYKKKDGCIDKVFLYFDKEKPVNKSYANMLDVIADLLPGEWTSKQKFSVDANTTEKLTIYP